MLNRLLMTVVLASLALVGALLIIAKSRIGNNESGPESWPPLIMSYKEQGQIGLIADGGIGTQTYQLDYDGPQKWKLTILDSTKRDNIGSWRAFDGNTINTYQADANYTDTITVSKEGVFYAPDQWLTPLYILSLSAKPNVVKQPSDQPNREVLELTEEVPCLRDIPVTEAQKQAGLIIPELTEAQKQLGVKPCVPDQKSRISTRQVTYTVDHLIPMQIIDKVDGIGVFTATVEKLTFK